MPSGAAHARSRPLDVAAVPRHLPLGDERPLQPGEVGVGPDLGGVGERGPAEHQRVRHRQGGDGAGDRGLQGGHRPGDPAAPAVPDDHRVLLAQRADDAGRRRRPRCGCRSRAGGLSEAP